MQELLDSIILLVEMVVQILEVEVEEMENGQTLEQLVMVVQES